MRSRWYCFDHRFDQRICKNECSAHEWEQWLKIQLIWKPDASDVYASSLSHGAWSHIPQSVINILYIGWIHLQLPLLKVLFWAVNMICLKLIIGFQTVFSTKVYVVVPLCYINFPCLWVVHRDITNGLHYKDPDWTPWRYVFTKKHCAHAFARSSGPFQFRHQTKTNCFILNIIYHTNIKN